MEMEKGEDEEDGAEDGVAHRRILAQMLSLEPEIEALRPVLGDARTNRLVARERREVFSVYPELRVCAWAGATLLATAAGILLKDNLDRLGPLTLSVLIGAAAAACYAWTWTRRTRASIVDDCVLLLGALLVSADVAFIESQYHLLDGSWKHHLLLLAVVHATGAYAYRSRMLLSLSIVALAGWIGIDRTSWRSHMAMPAFATAVALLLWRELDARFQWSGGLQPADIARRAEARFSRTLEHFAANFALFGAVTLIDDSAFLGLLVTLAVAALVIRWGFATRHEPFVLYAVVYAVVGVCAFVLKLDPADVKVTLATIAFAIATGIVALIALHRRLAR